MAFQKGGLSSEVEINSFMSRFTLSSGLSGGGGLSSGWPLKRGSTVISFYLCLHQVGEKLGKYEVEKRQAVENEDYDKAKLKKVQMDEYRLQVYKQLELHDLLELSGVRRSKTTHRLITLYIHTNI